MGRLSWRWGVLALLVAGLVALPSAATLLPARADAPSAADLLALVRSSASTPFSGYGESTGSLALPDVRELAELPGLLGGTTRTRTWWRGPRDARVDALTPVGERDVVLDEAGAWLWNSADDRAVRLVGDPEVRLPREADLVAPLLGRRLAGTPGVAVSTTEGERVAGRPTAGLRLTPPAGTATTIEAVDLLVDPGSGLALAVEVRAGGRTVLTSRLMDLDLATPAQVRTAFSPPPTADVQYVEAPDVAAAIDRFSPFLLPDELARLPRRDRVDGVTGGGVGTYGDGFTVLTLLPLPRDVARSAVRRIGDPDDDGVATVSTPLLNVVVVRRRGPDFLVAGTVPPAVLDAAVAQVRAEGLLEVGG